MSFRNKACLLLAGVTLTMSGAAFARVSNAMVARADGDRLIVTWDAQAPIDVYTSDRPDAAIASARLVSPGDRDGRAEITAEGSSRPYLLLRDTKDKSVVRVAERVLPLQQGSNFRDVGGYAAAGGKTVRWGMIYRSGASAMLNDGDIAQVQALGLRNLIDLRSDEERVFAPTRIDGVPYSAVGYSMARLIPSADKGPVNGGTLYRALPGAMVPQLRIIFGILKRQEGPIEYNCSAGQDRTGFVTAMILSALGVPRDTILRDYELSTRYRQPKWEMPHIDMARYPGNPVAQLFGRFQDDPRAAVAQPLHEADGVPFLATAFDEIDTKWGSVDAYLDKEVGVSRADLAALRRTYLE